jgi:hypothetical protein
VYLGGHGQYGEDGLRVQAERAIGRDDYGQAQCSFRKRSGKYIKCKPSSSRQYHDEVDSRSRPNAYGVLSLWELLFGTRKRRFKRRGPRYFERRQGPLSGRDVTFTNDIALVRLSHPISFTDKIQPVRLPLNDFSYLGYQSYVAGWGIQGPHDGPSLTLKGAELAVSRRLLC